MGHLLEWSVVRAKHALQKVWPQGVVTGSNSSFMHRMHSVSSQRLPSLLDDLMRHNNLVVIYDSLLSM
jgi:hypothetical protein